MSRPYQGQIRLLILLGVTGCALLLAGCSTTPLPARLNLTASQRQPCDPPAIGPLTTQGAIDGALIATAVAWKACAREKAGLVEAVDAFNAAVAPKKKWKWWPD